MDEPAWQQLYVNAEHDGTVGVISISRESYNSDVDSELNRAIDWLKEDEIENVIVTGDFHLSTQMVGADTNEFFPALEKTEEGFKIASTWSKTARRLNDEFKISVGCIIGKRCMGGFLELLMHCHYLISVDNAKLGMPEVTLPVVPGMEGCHWSFRKAKKDDWDKILKLLLEGNQVNAKSAVGWLIDYAGSLEDTIQTAWTIANARDHGLPKREVKENAFEGIPTDIRLTIPDNPGVEAARKVIVDTIKDSCGTDLQNALKIQAQHSADFMTTNLCKKGSIGIEFKKVMTV